jgi:protein-S-isoprenylcysteine O-methyltransferase Ste14
MTPYRWIISSLWLLFVAYWAIAAVGAKRSAIRRQWGWEVGLRLLMFLTIFALLRSQTLREFLGQMQRSASHSAILGWGGAAMCMVGLGLAFFARWHLGRNWGMPGSRKEEAQLITTGPYAHIRHPIYTGLILAMLGSAMGFNVSWALLLVFLGPYFVWNARREEALLLNLFPEQYPAYKARTGMLTPRLIHRR